MACAYSRIITAVFTAVSVVETAVSVVKVAMFAVIKGIANEIPSRRASSLISIKIWSGNSQPKYFHNIYPDLDPLKDLRQCMVDLANTQCTGTLSMIQCLTWDRSSLLHHIHTP